MAFCDESKCPSNDANRTFIVCNMCELTMYKILDPVYVIYSSSKGSTFGMRPPLRGAVFSLILLDTNSKKRVHGDTYTSKGFTYDFRQLYAINL
jgi:hypothetical protein